MTYTDILTNIKTAEQAREFVSEIDLLLDSLFKTKSDLVKTKNALGIGQNFLSAVTEKLKEGLLKNNISLDNLSKVKEYLLLLKVEIQKLKILRLSLAFEPSQNTIDNLFAWVVKNLGNGHILDIQKDQTILAGAIIEFEGKYQNLSLKKRLEEVFGEKREEITRALNS